MRILFCYLLLFAAFISARAQKPDTAAHRYIQYPVKGHIVLNSGNKITIRGLAYDDSANVVLFSPGPNIINGQYTYKGDVRTMQRSVVPVMDILRLKAKRQSFMKGAGVGALIGFGVGALLGYVTYSDDMRRTNEENEDRRGRQALGSGIAEAIPTGLIGGFAGGLFIKKRFPINGRKEKLDKTLDRLYH